MKITIIYDNTVWQKGLKADWGFACHPKKYIEGGAGKIIEI